MLANKIKKGRTEMNNTTEKANNQVENTIKEVSLTEKKRNYEAMGIPVERLWICHGLPMTSEA